MANHNHSLNEFLTQLNSYLLAWLAGFIDGEGYIGITFQRKKETRSQSPSARYHPYLIITSINLKILEEIKELTKSGRLYKMSHDFEHQKPAFQYKLSEMEKLGALLNAIRPYLRLKKEQCDLLLNFIEVRKKARCKPRRYRRGETSYTVEEELYQKLLTLNKRGR